MWLFKKNGIVGDRNLKPTETVKAEDLLPVADVYETFVYDGYTMLIEPSDGGEKLHVTVKSKIKDNIGYEWEITALFSNSTYRINYTDAVKTVVNYNNDGVEKSREKEYEDGVGRVQFSDVNTLKWENSMDTLSNTEFKRK